MKRSRQRCEIDVDCYGIHYCKYLIIFNFYILMG
jgi:hypothetical protein